MQVGIVLDEILATRMLLADTAAEHLSSRPPNEHAGGRGVMLTR
jgi:hypothetical protein